MCVGEIPLRMRSGQVSSKKNNAQRAKPTGVYGNIAALAGAGAFLGLVLPAAQAFEGNRTSCAIYGSGFVAVHGSSQCIRIGGRMRLKNVERGFSGGYLGSNPLPYAGTRGANWPGRAKPAATFQRWTR